MPTLTTQQRKDLKDAWKRVYFRGTPEKFYTDSGFWEYIKYVKTKDEHDPQNAVKPLPYWKPYIQVTFLFMLNCSRLLIPKSRQIMVSWMLAAFASWWAKSAEYQLVLIQSKKDVDAQKIVSKGEHNPGSGRIDFIEQNLPQWLQDPNIINGKGNKVGELLYSPQHRDKASGISVPWRGSITRAVPQGADQVRGDVPSLYMSDEAAFQDAFGESIDAIMPAITSRDDLTKLICASSVNAGSRFNNMCLEADGDIDQDEFNDSGVPWLEGLYESLPDGSLPYGMSSRVTPSGWVVLQVHYSADEDKNPTTEMGREWLKVAARGYIGGMKSAGWRQEMEIDYSASGGTLLFPHLLSDDSKILVPHMTWLQIKEKQLALYAGYDHGTTNPSSFVVWGIDPNGVGYALWEIYEPCRNIRTMAAKIKACPYYEQIKYIKCDPAIVNQKNQHAASGMRSVADLFSDEGITMSPGRSGADINLFHRLSLAWEDPENPTCFITADCRNLWREWQRLRWKKHSSEKVRLDRNEPEEIVDKNNHTFDSSAYVWDSRPEPPRMKYRGACGGLTFAALKEDKVRREREKEMAKHYVGAA